MLSFSRVSILYWFQLKPSVPLILATMWLKISFASWHSGSVRSFSILTIVEEVVNRVIEVFKPREFGGETLNTSVGTLEGFVSEGHDVSHLVFHPLVEVCIRDLGVPFLGVGTLVH